MQFGVQKGISGVIWVGSVNKKKNLFTKKEDKTIEVLSAVIELIKDNDEKNMTTELKDKNNRYILSLKVVKNEI